MTEKTQKDTRLTSLPAESVARARFLLAHLFPAPGMHLAHMQCGDGSVTAALALLAPAVHLTGYDPDKRAVNKARQLYNVPHLDFQSTLPALAGECDAVIHDFTFHGLYADHKENNRIFDTALDDSFGLLKPGGVLLQHNYAAPPEREGRYVLLEMPETAPHAARLTDYAAHAHNGTGFFLEEHPPRFPGTRLFRLPCAAAYEFLMRLPSEDSALADPDQDYGILSGADYRRLLDNLGARILYSSPVAHESLTALHEQGGLRLYDEDGRPQDIPARSFVALGQKIPSGAPRVIRETCPGGQPAHEPPFSLTGFRHLTSGRLVDIITPLSADECARTEILPYMIGAQDELYIYLEFFVPRPLVNSVPRTGKNLARQWAGYLPRPVSVPDSLFDAFDASALKDTVLFGRDHLKLKPAADALVSDGPRFFPHPGMIKMQVSTRYLAVCPREDSPLRACRAEDVLAALDCGVLPAGRLRAQIIALMEQLNRPVPPLLKSPARPPDSQSVPVLYARDIALRLSIDDAGYRLARGTGGGLQTLHGRFIALPSKVVEEISFALPTQTAPDRALILPLLRDERGAPLAGFTTDSPPVPALFGKKNLHLTLPSLALPCDIETPDQARHYIAAHYNVAPTHIMALGARFFPALGLTPLRFMPFALTTVPPQNRPDAYAPLAMLWDMMIHQTSDERMTSLLAAAVQAYLAGGDEG